MLRITLCSKVTPELSDNGSENIRTLYSACALSDGRNVVPQIFAEAISSHRNSTDLTVFNSVMIRISKGRAPVTRPV
jgi:hypothetical protein